jgi:hypothetical protein
MHAYPDADAISSIAPAVSNDFHVKLMMQAGMTIFVGLE